jgi:hypothetical protein
MIRWLICALDGKQVSIEGTLVEVRSSWGDVDGCHSWFCFDSSMREGRSYNTKVSHSDSSE